MYIIGSTFTVLYQHKDLDFVSCARDVIVVCHVLLERLLKFSASNLYSVSRGLLGCMQPSCLHLLFGCIRHMHFLAQAVFPQLIMSFTLRPDCMRYSMDEPLQTPVPGCLSKTAGLS